MISSIPLIAGVVLGVISGFFLLRAFIFKLSWITAFKTKLSKLLAWLFGVTELTPIYYRFYRSLAWYQKLFFRRYRRIILIDPTYEGNKEYGLDIYKYQMSVVLVINPDRLEQAQLPMRVIFKFLHKLLRSKLNLCMIRIDIERQALDPMELGKSISNVLDIIARYMNLPLDYVLNFQHDESDAGAIVWHRLAESSKAQSIFWDRQYGDKLWLENLFSDSEHYHLQFDDKTTSAEMVALYHFLNQIRHATSASRLSEYPSSTSLNYRGFVITAAQIPMLEGFPQMLNRRFRRYRLPCVLKNAGFAFVFLAGSIAMASGLIQLSMQPQSSVESVLDSHKITIERATVEDYKASQRLFLSDYHASLLHYLYPNWLVEKMLRQRWQHQLRAALLERNMAQDMMGSHDLISKLPITDFQKLHARIKKNIWLWSYVSGVSIPTINLWLRLSDQTDYLYNRVLPSRATRLSGGEKNKLIAEIKQYVESFDSSKLEANFNYPKAKSHQAMTILWLNQLLSYPEISGALHQRISAILDDQNVTLSAKEMSIFDRYATILQLKQSVGSLKPTKDIDQLVAAIESVYATVKKRSVGQTVINQKFNIITQYILLLLQNQSELPLFADIQSSEYYSKDFYQNQVSSLYRRLSEFLEQAGRQTEDIMALKRQLIPYFTRYDKDYAQYYLNSLAQALNVNSGHGDEDDRQTAMAVYIATFNKNALMIKLPDIIADIKKNIMTLSADKQQPPMKNTIDLFVNFDHFVQNSENYQNLMAFYASLLQLGSGSLYNYYDGSQANFKQQMQTFLRPMGLSDALYLVLIKPAEQAQSYARQILKKLVELYWQQTLDPVFANLGQYFPFSRHADTSINNQIMTNILGENGQYFSYYRDKIQPLIRANPGFNWLNIKQKRQYDSMVSLRNLLWDGDAKKKPFVLNIRTSSAVPIYSRIKPAGWFSSASHTTASYTAVLTSNQQKVMAIGIKGIDESFKVDWWLQSNTASLSLLQNQRLYASKNAAGQWALLRLIAGASQRCDLFSWFFNDNKTVVSFYVLSPMPWQIYAQQDMDKNCDNREAKDGNF
ncbi:MAG: hypothetical protein ACO2ZM_03410 [Francisellaceae bacterium]